MPHACLALLCSTDNFWNIYLNTRGVTEQCETKKEMYTHPHRRSNQSIYLSSEEHWYRILNVLLFSFFRSILFIHCVHLYTLSSCHFFLYSTHHKHQCPRQNLFFFFAFSYALYLFLCNDCPCNLPLLTTHNRTSMPLARFFFFICISLSWLALLCLYCTTHTIQTFMPPAGFEPEPQ